MSIICRDIYRKMCCKLHAHIAALTVMRNFCVDSTFISVS